MDKFFSRHGLHRPDSKPARAQLASLERRISDGQEAYLLGI